MAGHIEVNRGNNNGIPLSGIGYIIVPSDAERSEYIERCYRNHTVSINGGLGCSNMHNVKITDGALERIKFPSSEGDLGTAVIWIRESFYNKPVVIDTISSDGDTGFGGEGQQVIEQASGSQSARVHVDGPGATVNVNAVGGNATAAKVNIKSSGGEGGEVNVDASGSINQTAKHLNVTLTKDFTLIVDDGSESAEGKQIINLHGDAKQIHFLDHWGHELTMDEEKVEFKDVHEGNDEDDKNYERIITMDKDKTEFKDAFENTFVVNKDETHYTDKHGNEVILNDDHTQFKCNKFDIGDGAEPLVLGQTLVDTLGQLCDAIKSITVPTPHGPSSTPINAAQFASIKSNLKTILSQLSNTD